jgi:hypothetical protein
MAGQSAACPNPAKAASFFMFRSYKREADRKKYFNLLLMDVTTFIFSARRAHLAEIDRLTASAYHFIMGQTSTIPSVFHGVYPVLFPRISASLPQYFLCFLYVPAPYPCSFKAFYFGNPARCTRTASVCK